MTTHSIKCKPEYYEPLINGTKTAEIRENDRDYQVLDILIIQEFNRYGYTGREATYYVTHVLTDEFVGLPKGWVMLSLGKL